MDAPRLRNERVWLLDEIRGAAILLMVLYHAGYDLVAIFGVDFPLFFSPQVNFLRDVMAGAFIFISGCACRFSRSNLKRGLMTFGFGMVMTLVTAFVIPDQIILFGILHCLGTCMILFGLLEKLLDRADWKWGFTASAILLYLTFTVPRGIFGGLTYHLRLPEVLYQTPFGFPLGFPSESFFSSDYYPLIPWIFLFLAGAYLGIPVRKKQFPPFFYRMHCRPLAFIGRHTIVVYLLHQPIIYGILFLVFR